MFDALGDMLHRSASMFPNNPAIVEFNRTQSYAELDDLSGRIALKLTNVTVRPGDRVVLISKKSIEAIAAIHGIIKAGCAYVPLDPKVSLQRAVTILRDAAPTIVIIELRLVNRMKAILEAMPTLPVVTIDRDGMIGEYRSSLQARESGTAHHDNTDIPLRSDQDRVAYILYTSGSTGEPKGVQQGEASLLAFVSWAIEEFKITNCDRLSCHASLHFDLTTLDIFSAAATGACLVLVPDEILIFPQKIAELIEREQISIWYSVPYALTLLLENGGMAQRNVASLREILFAGERIPQATLQQLWKVFPNARLTNLFGPTETNVCTFHRVVYRDIESEDPCPIGKACPFAKIRIVKSGDSCVDPGETGELLVGGACVMIGYLAKPEDNWHAFVEIEGQRFYRTGDLVRLSPDSGLLQFLGRLDRQVKIRGFRIELDAIEAILIRHAGVRNAAAFATDIGSGVMQIVAAVERHHGVNVCAEELQSDLDRTMGHSYVPCRIFMLDQLPRSRHDKVDYPSLRCLLEAKSLVSPSNTLE